MVNRKGPDVSHIPRLSAMTRRFISYPIWSLARQNRVVWEACLSDKTGVVSSEFPVLSVPTGTIRIILSVPPELRVPGAVIWEFRFPESSALFYRLHYCITPYSTISWEKFKTEVVQKTSYSTESVMFAGRHDTIENVCSPALGWEPQLILLYSIM